MGSLSEQGWKQRQTLQRQKPTRKRQKRRRRRRRPRRQRRGRRRRRQVMRGRVPHQQKLHLQEMVNLLKILLKRNQNLKLRVLRSQLWGRRANLLTQKRTRKKMLRSMLSCDNTYSERRFEVDGLQIC